MNATDLLHISLDFASIWQNDNNKYKANVLAGNESSYYRILQIEALLSALKITPEYADRVKKDEFGERINKPDMTNLEYFLTGQFLEERSFKSYQQDLLDEIFETVKDIISIDWEPSDYRPFWVIFILYKKLYNYRKKIHPFTKSKDLLEYGGSIGPIYHIHLQNDIAESLAFNLQKIDDTLSKIIDPHQREISMNTLVRKYKYPDIDLREFDALSWI